MQNFDKIIANPLKNFLEIEQKKGETEKDIDENFIKEIKHALNQNVEVILFLIVTSFSYYILWMQLKIEQKIDEMRVKYEEAKTESSKKDEAEPKEANAENADKSENINEVQPQDNQLLEDKVEDDMNEEKTQVLKKMVKNITGVLLSLKQSGDFNIAENKYFTELCNNIFEDNSDEFHEINHLLLNICSK